MTSTSSTKAEVTNLQKKLRDIEKRLEELETGNPLHGTLPEGGTLTVRDASGNVVALLGVTSEGDDGFQVWGPNEVYTYLDVGDVDGWRAPWLENSWYKPADNVSVTSGTFVDVWSTSMQNVWTKEMTAHIPTLVDSGTTLELKVTFGGSGTDTGVLEIVGTGGFVTADLKHAHGLTHNTGPYVVQLEARRSAGSGSALVYRPYDVGHGHGFSHLGTNGWA